MLYYKKALSWRGGIRVVAELLLCSVIGGIPFYLLKENDILSPAWATTLAGIAGPLVYIGLFGKVRPGELKYFFSRRVPVHIYFLLALTTLCLNIAIDPLPRLVPLPDWMEDTFNDLSRNRYLFFFGAVICAPLLEELIFRGILLGGLAARYGAWKSLVVSTLLFAAAHLNPAQSVGIILPALLAGWAYIKLQNLLAPIVVHLINNALAWSLTGVSGGGYRDNLAALFPGTLLYLMIVLAGGVVFAGCWAYLRNFGKEAGSTGKTEYGG